MGVLRDRWPLGLAVVLCASALAGSAAAQTPASRPGDTGPCANCTTAGAYLRFDAGLNTVGGAAPAIGGTGLPTSPNTLTYGGRTFGFFDHRATTGFGALRLMARGGLQFTSSPNKAVVYVDRAFMELGGATIGKATSFFDFRSGTYGFGQPFVGGGSFTGDMGVLLAGFEFKTRHVSAGGSVEHAAVRRNGVWDAGTDALVVNDLPGPLSPTCPATGGWMNFAGSPLVPGTATRCRPADYAPTSMPDFVARVRAHQAWGSAQAAFALHRVQADVYGADVQAGAPPVGPGQYTGIAPPARTGWAMMGGVDLVSRALKPDHIWTEFVYSLGAPSYAGLALNGTFAQFWKYNNATSPSTPTLGAAWALDGVFANAIAPAATAPAGTSIELTRAWSVGAAFERHATSSVAVAIFGTYDVVDYNATASTLICESPKGPVRTPAGGTPNFSTGSVIGCNPDFALTSAGVHVVWSPRADLMIGPEVMYTRLAIQMPSATTRFNGSPVTGLFAPGNQTNFSVMVRLVFIPARQFKR